MREIINKRPGEEDINTSKRVRGKDVGNTPTLILCNASKDVVRKVHIALVVAVDYTSAAAHSLQQKLS